MTTPVDIWEYVPAGSVSTGDALIDLLTRARELHRIHGLELGSPLLVSATSRTAAAITQTVSEVAGVVTVERT